MNEIAQVKGMGNSFAKYISRAEDSSEKYSAKIFCRIILTQAGNTFSAIRKCESMKMITFLKSDPFRRRLSEKCLNLKTDCFTPPEKQSQSM